jgi:hypothetical protein
MRIHVLSVEPMADDEKALLQLATQHQQQFQATLLASSLPLSGLFFFIFIFIFILFFI